MDFWKSQKSNRKNSSDDADRENLMDPYLEDVVGYDDPEEIPDPKPDLNTSREPSRETLGEKENEMVKDFRTNQSGALQMKVARPKKLREATDIAESLMEGQTIVLNLDELSDSDGRRMIDYIAGIIFAIRGKIERPADRTFLLTPYGVQVATEEKEAE